MIYSDNFSLPKRGSKGNPEEVEENFSTVSGDQWVVSLEVDNSKCLSLNKKFK